MAFNISLLDDVDRANDSTPPPGASWVDVASRVGGEGLVVTGSALARKSSGSYRQGNSWSSSFTGSTAGIAVQLQTIASSATNNPAFQIYFSYEDPNTTFPRLGRGFKAEFGQIDADTLVIDVSPNGSTSGAWQTTDDPAVGDTYALTFDGTSVKLSRWRSNTETVLINKLYNDPITGGGSFGTAFDASYIGAPYWVMIDMMGDQTIRLERVYAGVSQMVRPDADTVTTGWSSTPLYSKINEAIPDGTIITATAA